MYTSSMMTKKSGKIVYTNPWMTVREDELEFPNGHVGIYGVVEKKDFALIIPFDGTFLHFVEEYRYPIEKRQVAFPQGSHESNEYVDPLVLAHDELEEELGLKASSMQEIGFLYQAPGYSTQGFHVFLATDLREGVVKPDPTEADLIHKKMTIEEFEAAVKNGTFDDGPSLSAYSLFKLQILS
jgi:ADP-ribose pyrophosphatase